MAEPFNKFRLILLNIAVLSFCSQVLAVVNLFLSRNETKALLGHDGQLFYMREGVPNEKALQHVLALPSGVNTLHFKWTTTEKNVFVYYELHYVASPRQALVLGSNINSSGLVPNTESEFTVTLECSGLVGGPVLMTILLNLTLPQDAFSVSLRRTTDCLFEARAAAALPGLLYNVSSSPPPELASNVSTAATTGEPAGSDSTLVFYVAVASACVFILVAAFVVLLCYLNSPARRRRRNRRDSALGDPGEAGDLKAAETAKLREDGMVVEVQEEVQEEEQGQEVSETQAVRDALISRHDSLSASMASGFTDTVYNRYSEISEGHSEVLYEAVESVRIERDRVQLTQLLLEGEYGELHVGVLKAEAEDGTETHQNILVRALKAEPSEPAVQKFLTDGCQLLGMCHKHLATPLGFCIHDCDVPLQVLLCPEGGILKTFLQLRAQPPSLSTQQLVYMAVQVIRGLQYMHRRKLTHGDVSARHCIVDSQLQVKLTDAALSRDLFPADYAMVGEELMPVKWLAPEAFDSTAASSSPADVWSLGVLLWELTSLGLQPYPDVAPEMMLDHLRQGHRATQPPSCPDQLFAVMACCWALQPGERPRMSQLYSCLQQFYATLRQFI